MSQTSDERITVLIVEDETLIALAIEDSLDAAGYRVNSRSSGRSAVSAIETQPVPSAAVVSMNLGDDTNGQEVIRRLRRRDPNLPIIVLTGYTPDSEGADLRGLGGPTERMQKPHDADELLRLLAYLLKRPNRMPGADRRASPATTPATPRLMNQ